MARSQASIDKVSDKLKKVDKERRKHFGHKLKRQRQSLQLTQMEMSKLTGQTYFTFISNVESGGTKIPSKDLRLWADALQVNINDFTKAYLSACDQNLFECLFSSTEREFKFGQEFIDG